ncbi:MAG TPA: FHA domain-containing protein [Acidimicrobiales bacterium]|nr:FHA domain-containing protein [Acidimicrobiales bacterium]
MPEDLLTILKFVFLALVWLFFARVLRAVWAELSPAAVAPPASASAAAPASPRGTTAPARVKVVDPPDRRGRMYDLADEVTIGRASGCQIALEDDKAVSQLHARLFRRDGRLYLEDLGSTNGTYLNAKKVAGPVALARGDRVQVGRTVLEVTK